MCIPELYTYKLGPTHPAEKLYPTQMLVQNKLDNWGPLQNAVWI